jgi:hypothetical protein
VRKCIVVLIAFGGAIHGFGASDWAVPEAPIRFEIRVDSRPNEPCAGVIAILPDQGALPRPAPGTVVLDDSGTALDHECIWHNPAEGLGLVFQPPAAGDSVFVYCYEANRVSGRGADSSFCPSLLLYSQMQSGSLRSAYGISGSNPPGSKARLGRVSLIGQQGNPIGLDDHYLSFYRGYLRARPGKTYLCTISDEGSEIRVNGKKVASWPGVHTREGGGKGDYGNSVNLSGDLHLIEYFHFEREGPQEAHLCWRVEGESADPLPVTVPADAYVKSGRGHWISAESRDGVPLAFIDVAPVSYLWLGETPVNLYELQPALLETNPEGTEYRWDLGQGMVSQTDRLLWLIEGSDPVQAKLISRRGAMESSARKSVYFDSTPGGASINRAADRRMYRKALLNRCRAVPESARPCGGWSEEIWTIFFEVIEPFQGGALLQQVITRSQADLAARGEDARAKVEGLYFDLLRLSDPGKAIEWAQARERTERNNSARFRWMDRQMKTLMYDLENPEEARKKLSTLRKLAPAAGIEGKILMMVRAGDLELLSGNPDSARKIYAAAQDVSTDQRKHAGTLKRFRNGTTTPGMRGADWRKDAVHAGTYYNTVKNLLEQGSLLEARETLDRWEIELPLSKLSGQFVSAESAYYVEAKDCRRVVSQLKAFRIGAGIANELPELLLREMNCLRQIGKTEEMKKLVDWAEKNLPLHPVTREVSALQ